jgi:FecR protein
MRRRTGSRFALLTAVLAAAIGFAQPQPPQQPQQEQGPPEPGHGIARLSLVNGEVSVRRGDNGDWVAAVANAPVGVNDHLATSASARAEVQFDAGNFLRLGANSEAQFAQLETNRYQIQLARGTADFSVLRQTNADIEVDTPLVSVRPKDRGNYRITTTEDGQTEVTVRSGQVEVYTPRGVETVTVGKTMLVRGDPASPEFQIVAAAGLDDWDRWNSERDRRMEAAGNNVYNKYVSPDVYGAESLEGYGRWVQTPDYGNVWTPQVGSDWSPYHDGRWAWDDYYGWEWVSYDPWGWAPYHYGRWFYNIGYGGWCWWPGSIYARHYWAPAYVGFFGFGGGGFGIGFGFGNVGWVPLAPFERFHPWWGRGFYGGRGGFYNRTTVINNVNVYNTYRNARVANGVTAVNSRNFASGRFGNGSYVRPSQGDLRSAGMVNGRLGIQPTARSTHFSDRAVTNVPRTSSNQRFFTRTGGPNGTPGFANSRYATPNGGSFRQGNSAAQGSAGGFNRGGQGSAFPQTSRGSNNAGGNSGGWRRFGDPASGSNVPSRGGFGSSAAAPSRGSTGVAPSGAMPSARGMQSPNGAQGGSSSNGWRRFGEPGGQSASPSGSAGRGGNGSNGGWQRFGSPNSGSAPRSQFSAPNRDSSGRVQVNPPMVRERGNPQYNTSPQQPYTRPGAPQQYNRPSMPQQQYSRPSMPQQQYSRPSMPQQQYSRPSMPQQQYNRPSMPQQQYNRPSMPQQQYNRPSMPQYSRPSTPAPQYSRPSGGGYGGGGGGRNFGGGGGGGSRPSYSGGGGGGRSSGGGGGGHASHGGGRR